MKCKEMTVGWECRCGRLFPLVPSDYVDVDKIGMGSELPYCVRCGGKDIGVSTYSEVPEGCLWVGNDELMGW